jgi:hypothetical protein
VIKYDFALDDHILPCLNQLLIIVFITFFYFIAIGDRILTHIQQNNERRIQQTYKQLVETERKRMENEYQQKSEEIARKWKAQLDEQRLKSQKVKFFSLNRNIKSVLFLK